MSANGQQQRLKIAGLTGVAFAVFQFITIPLQFFFVLTPAGLLTAIITVIFHLRVPSIVGLLAANLLLIFVTIWLTVGAYRGKKTFASLLALGIAANLLIAWGSWLLRVGIFVSPDSGFLAIYTVDSGILLVLLLFAVYGVVGDWQRVPLKLLVLAVAIMAAAVLIPLGTYLSSQAQLSSISGHLYRPDGTTISGDAVLILDPNPIVVRGDPSGPGLTKAKGEYHTENIPAGHYSIVAAATDKSFYSATPTPVEVTRRHNTEQNLVLVPGGSITGHISGFEPYQIKPDILRVRWARQPEGNGWSFFSGSADVADSGNYSLNDVAPGKIRMEIYRGYSRLVSAEIEVKSGEQAQQDFSLTFLR